MADPYAYPPATRQRRPDAVGVLALLVFRLLVDYWLELTLLGLLALPVIVAARAGWGWLAGDGDAALVVVILMVRPVRRWFGRILYAASVRRRFGRAVDAARITSFFGQRPAVRRVRAVPAGEMLTVRVPVGGTVGDLDTAAEQLAVALGLRQVRVTRWADNARQASVALVRRDPLAADAPPWPHLDAERLSVWEPIPVGVDENGEPVTISLPERNVLLGGEPGAGKSASLSLLVATAALDPTVRLHLFDGKLVELAAWAGCADSTVGVDTAEANKVLRELQAEMDQRYVTLLANRARKVTRGGGLPRHVLVGDELAHYLLAPDRKVRTEFAELLRDLVARGRAAGLIVLAATQKPAHDIIPTALRDLFGFRWALRCMTPQASDTVLGAGWASLGYSAADIDAAQRGVGWLLHEGGEPLRLRCHYLEDTNLADLARRARSAAPRPGHPDLRRHADLEHPVNSYLDPADPIGPVAEHDPVEQARRTLVRLCAYLCAAARLLDESVDLLRAHGFVLALPREPEDYHVAAGELRAAAARVRGQLRDYVTRSLTDLGTLPDTP